MDALIATAIHDAKNGLNALNTWLMEAQKQAPSAALEQATAVSERISAQLVELLTLYRASEGSLRLAIDDQMLDDFLADTCAELHLPASSSIHVDCDLAAAAEIGSWAFDAYQVKFVLLDALRNALRHATATIKLSVSLEPSGGIRFTVADDGPGFPETVLAGEKQAMHKNSSGLGLSFAHLIAAQHVTPSGQHGRVEFTNPTGQFSGACFSLILP